MAQEAIDLAEDELGSIPEGSVSWLSPPHSPTPPPVASSDHENREYGIVARTGGEQDSPYDSEILARTSLESASSRSTLSIRPSASTQADPDQINDLKPAVIEIGGEEAAEHFERDENENRKWTLFCLDTDSEHSVIEVREPGTRVKDANGRVIWQEFSSPRSRSRSRSSSTR